MFDNIIDIYRSTDENRLDFIIDYQMLDCNIKQLSIFIFIHLFIRKAKFQCNMNICETFFVLIVEVHKSWNMYAYFFFLE